jgi:hypothetical protein
MSTVLLKNEKVPKGVSSKLGDDWLLPLSKAAALKIALIGPDAKAPYTAGTGSGGTVCVFRPDFALEDAIGSHACSLEANTRVTNGIPFGSPLLLPVCTVNSVQPH